MRAGSTLPSGCWLRLAGAAIWPRAVVYEIVCGAVALAGERDGQWAARINPLWRKLCAFCAHVFK